MIMFSTVLNSFLTFIQVVIFFAKMFLKVVYYRFVVCGKASYTERTMWKIIKISGSAILIMSYLHCEQRRNCSEHYLPFSQ